MNERAQAAARARERDESRETVREREREITKAIGRKLREARNARGLSLTDFEEISGDRFPAVVMGSYERGDRTPSAARLVVLASILERPVGWFYGGEGGNLPTGSEAESIFALAQRIAVAAGELATSIGIAVAPGERVSSQQQAS